MRFDGFVVRVLGNRAMPFAYTIRRSFLITHVGRIGTSPAAGFHPDLQVKISCTASFGV